MTVATGLQLPSPRKPIARRAGPVTAPAAEPLPTPDASSITFSTPRRRILTAEDLKLFQASPTYKLLINFVLALNTAALDKSLLYNLDAINPAVTSILKVLDRVEELVKSNPRVDNDGSRFGNPSFHGFYDDLTKYATQIHKDMGLGLLDGAIDELSIYLNESFGNRTRIDYGSGHELNFIAYLLSLHQLCLLPPSAFPSLSLLVFPKYIHLMRQIQSEYYLEPAGSHGVWGLDDYNFLPFLFGSAQLFHHPHLRPMSIHNTELLDELGDEYMYLDCIRFINSIKTTAGLRWHSPMLDDISSAKSWGKVNVGMAKMWEVEVLGKLPVMQHFMFGGLLPAEEDMGKDEEILEDVEEEEGFAGRTAEEVEGVMGKLDREGMRHVHSSWGECCGIKVPSAIAAREAGEKGGLRKVSRIPFD